jgi:general stress protein 26
MRRRYRSRLPAPTAICHGSTVKEQKRARRIAMTKEELDAFLADERMCRVGSVDGDGAPHVSPLWFVWDGSALWLWSLVKSQRWVNLMRDPRVSIAIDGGRDYGELRGVELLGRIGAVGDAPRRDEAHPETTRAEALWAKKYSGGRFVSDGKHAWLRLDPDKIVSWDFRKLGDL